MPSGDNMKTPEGREKVSKALKKRYANQEHHLKGRTRSLESCRKQSRTLKEKFKVEEHHLKGRTRSLESRRKQSKGMRENNSRYRHIGEKHPQWNPDRELVKKTNVTAKAMAKLLERCVVNKTDKTYKLLGYSKEEFIRDIEVKFYNHSIYGKMTWYNHGWGPGTWQFHHIKPVERLVKEGIIDPKIVNSLENLQPLWFNDHMEAHSQLGRIPNFMIGELYKAERRYPLDLRVFRYPLDLSDYRYPISIRNNICYSVDLDTVQQIT